MQLQCRAPLITPEVTGQLQPNLEELQKQIEVLQVCRRVLVRERRESPKVVPLEGEERGSMGFCSTECSVGEQQPPGRHSDKHHLLLLEAKFRSDPKRCTTTTKPVERSASLTSPTESPSPGTAGTKNLQCGQVLLLGSRGAGAGSDLAVLASLLGTTTPQKHRG